MSFIWPIMLVLLALVPVFILFYALIQKRRRNLASQFGSLGLSAASAGYQPGLSRHLPPAFFLTGLTLLIVGLARPQAEVNLPSLEGTVILAFDVSGSMAAEDLEPTRMEAAKAVAREFVQRQPSSIQIGVVAFSNSGFSVQAPTNVKEDILAAIDRLAPQQGTSLGQGIMSALNTLDTAGPTEVQRDSAGNLLPTPTPTPFPASTHSSTVMIMLTDGENLEPPDPLEAAAEAAHRGVRIYTVGIGSTAGITLHVNGFTVHTRLDEGLLQQIAQVSGGKYYNAQDEQDLQSIYDNIDLQLVIKPEKTEITSIFAGISLLILLIGGILFFGGRQ